MQVIKNFLNSEKGILALLLLIMGTVLFGLGKIDFNQWQNFAIWVFGIYTGGKSIQGAAAQLASRPKPEVKSLKSNPGV